MSGNEPTTTLVQRLAERQAHLQTLTQQWCAFEQAELEFSRHLVTLVEAISRDAREREPYAAVFGAGAIPPVPHRASAQLIEGSISEDASDSDSDVAAPTDALESPAPLVPSTVATATVVTAGADNVEASAIINPVGASGITNPSILELEHRVDAQRHSHEIQRRTWESHRRGLDEEIQRLREMLANTSRLEKRCHELEQQLGESERAASLVVAPTTALAVPATPEETGLVAETPLPAPAESRGDGSENVTFPGAARPKTPNNAWVGTVAEWMRAEKVAPVPHDHDEYGDVDVDILPASSTHAASPSVVPDHSAELTLLREELELLRQQLTATDRERLAAIAELESLHSAMLEPTPNADAFAPSASAESSGSDSDERFPQDEYCQSLDQDLSKAWNQVRALALELANRAPAAAEEEELASLAALVDEFPRSPRTPDQLLSTTGELSLALDHLCRQIRSWPDAGPDSHEARNGAADRLNTPAWDHAEPDASPRIDTDSDARNRLDALEEEIARIPTLESALRDAESEVQSLRDELALAFNTLAEAQTQALPKNEPTPVDADAVRELETLRQELQSAKEQADELFSVMKKGERGLYSDLKSLQADYGERRQAWERQIEDLKAQLASQSRNAGASASQSGSGSPLSEEVERLNRTIDELKAERDHAIAQAGELFSSLDAGTQTLWIDRDALKSDYQSQRLQLESTIQQLQIQLAGLSGGASPAKPTSDDESRLRTELADLRKASENDRALLQSAQERILELTSAFSAGERGLYLELMAAREELREHRASTPAVADASAAAKFEEEIHGLQEENALLQSEVSRLQELADTARAEARKYAAKPPADESATEQASGPEIAKWESAIQSLQEENDLLQSEVSRLQELADTARAEAKSRVQVTQKEIDILRDQIAELSARQEEPPTLFVNGNRASAPAASAGFGDREEPPTVDNGNFDADAHADSLGLDSLKHDWARQQEELLQALELATTRQDEMERELQSAQAIADQAEIRVQSQENRIRELETALAEQRSASETGSSRPPATSSPSSRDADADAVSTAEAELARLRGLLETSLAEQQNACNDRDAISHELQSIREQLAERDGEVGRLLGEAEMLMHQLRGRTDQVGSSDFLPIEGVEAGGPWEELERLRGEAIDRDKRIALLQNQLNAAAPSASASAEIRNNHDELERERARFADLENQLETLQREMQEQEDSFSVEYEKLHRAWEEAQVALENAQRDRDGDDEADDSSRVSGANAKAEERIEALEQTIQELMSRIESQQHAIAEREHALDQLRDALALTESARGASANGPLPTQSDLGGSREPDGEDMPSYAELMREWESAQEELQTLRDRLDNQSSAPVRTHADEYEDEYADERNPKLLQAIKDREDSMTALREMMSQNEELQRKLAARNQELVALQEKEKGSVSGKSGKTEPGQPKTSLSSSSASLAAVSLGAEDLKRELASTKASWEREREEWKTAWQESQSTIQRLGTELVELESRFDSRRPSGVPRIDEIRELEQSLSNREATINSLQTQLEDLQKSLHAATASSTTDPAVLEELEELRQYAAAMTDREQQSVQALSQTQEDLAAALEEKNHYAKQFADIQDQLGKVGELEELIVGLKDRSTALHAENERLVVKLADADTVQKKMREQINTLEAGRASSISNNADASGAGASVTSTPAAAQLLRATAKIKEQEAHIRDFTDQNQKLRQECDRLLQQIAEGRARDQELRRLKKIIQEMADREKLIEDLQAKIAERDQTIDRINEHVEDLLSQGIDRTRMQLESEQEHGQEEVLAEYQQEIENLHAKLSASDERINELEEANREMEARMSTFLQEHEGIEDIHEQLRQLEEGRIRRMELQEELDHKQMELDATEKQRKMDRENYEQFQNELLNQIATLKASQARERLTNTGLTSLVPSGTGSQATNQSGELGISIDEKIRAFRQHLDSVREQEKSDIKKKTKRFWPFGKTK